MNYFDTTHHDLGEPLNVSSPANPPLVHDEGETIIIEGVHVAVDKNNNRINKVSEHTIPLWLIGEYA